MTVHLTSRCLLQGQRRPRGWDPGAVLECLGETRPGGALSGRGGGQDQCHRAQELPRAAPHRPRRGQVRSLLFWGHFQSGIGVFYGVLHGFGQIHEFQSTVPQAFAKAKCALCFSAATAFLVYGFVQTLHCLL